VLIGAGVVVFIGAIVKARREAKAVSAGLRAAGGPGLKPRTLSMVRSSHRDRRHAPGGTSKTASLRENHTDTSVRFANKLPMYQYVLARETGLTQFVRIQSGKYSLIRLAPPRQSFAVAHNAQSHTAVAYAVGREQRASS